MFRGRTGRTIVRGRGEGRKEEGRGKAGRKGEKTREGRRNSALVIEG